MSDIEKFNNTKWDVSEWSEEMKTQWQKKMMDLGFTWKGYGRRVIHLESVAYFIDTDITCQIYAESVHFDLSNLKELKWGDAFPEKKTKPSIFDNPEWVTAIDTNLEVGLVEGKDYKVYKVEEDKFWVYNDMQSSEPVWYYRDRFHKVAYEDLLPTKDIEGSFDNLVYVEPEYISGLTYYTIEKSKMSYDQWKFLLSRLPLKEDCKGDEPFLNLSPSGKRWFDVGTKSESMDIYIGFNDIFKHKSEI